MTLISLLGLLALSTATPAAETPKPAPDLGALGSMDTKAPTGDRWDAIDQNSRFLFIMGTVDGLAATGAGAPCFPGKDNAKLDAQLKARGFGSKDPVTLASALTKLSAPKAKCVTQPARGYTTELLRNLPDDQLATYLTGAVRGYASRKDCPIANQGPAAATVVADLFGDAEAKSPVELLTAALPAGCATAPKQ